MRIAGRFPTSLSMLQCSPEVFGLIQMVKSFLAPEILTTEVSDIILSAVR